MIDPRTDIYSLGALWYEMMVGRPPVGAGVAAALDKIDGLSAQRRSALLRCLADIEDRYASTDELVADLNPTST